jgi:hypothetical protein
MRATAIIFWVLTAFFLVVGIAYAFLTGTYQPLGIEPMGFPALLMAGALSLLVALTLTIFSRTYPDRAEEEPDAAVESETGVQGSFAPYSWYPLWTAIGAAWPSWGSRPAGGSSLSVSPSS